MRDELISSKEAEGRSGTEEPGPSRYRKKAYRAPRLSVLGDLRGITLGGSAVISDSATSLRRNG